jgi:hypothetical protein
MATSFSAFVTTVTRDRIVPKIVDNILAGNVATMRFLSNSRPWTGGHQLVLPIKYQTSSAGGSYKMWDTFSTSQQNTRHQAKFDPKYNYQSVVLANPQLAVNSGDSKILDLLKVEMASAADDMADRIGTQFYDAGGTTSGADDIIGLDAAIDDGNTTATWGEINGTSTYTTWVSTLTSNSGAITIAQMASMYDSAKVGNDAPSIVIMHPSEWTTYEGLLQATINYHTQVQGYPKMTRFGISRAAGTGQTGDIGFDTLFFRGIPVVSDEKCDDGVMYMINEKHLWFARLEHPKYPSKQNQYGFAWTGLGKEIIKFIKNLIIPKLAPC